MIQTGVPNSLLRPQTFHTFTFLRASGKLTNVPLRIALIGAKLTTGATATAGTVYEMAGLTAGDGDALFGQSSELAIMHRESIACASLFGAGPRVFCVPIAESAGVANVQTITCVGTATTDGNQTFKIAGRLFIVGVRKDDAQNTNAAAIAMRQVLLDAARERHAHETQARRQLAGLPLDDEPTFKMLALSFLVMIGVLVHVFERDYRLRFCAC